MSEVIDLKIIASTSSAEEGLHRVGKTAEDELGSSGKLGKAGKGGEDALTRVRGGVFNLAAGFAGLSTKLVEGAATLGVGVGVVAVKMAGDFQEATTTLVTGAGESVQNLGMIRDGILSLSGAVGKTPAELAAGMYQIESAGYHGAAGLAVLKSAAEGAAVGGAQMGDVANVLTSALNAYRMPASSAVSVTNDLVATVASGKMTMQDLAVSLGAVLAPASAVGVGLSQVSAAIATMTMQGTPAADAATYLRQTLVSLAAPKAAAVKTFQEIGMSATAVAAGLKAKPDGFIDQLRQITEHLDKKFPASAALAKAQFALVKSGAETTDKALANLANNGGKGYIQALQNIAGGSRQMMGMLELTGGHVGTLQANFEAISGSANKGGTAINGFALVQDDFNQRMAAAKAGLDAFMIRLGTALLPIVGKVATFMSTTILPVIGKELPVALKIAGDAFNWIGTNVMPTVLGVFRGFGQWISQNQPLIHGIADVIVNTLAVAFKILSVVVPIALHIVGAAIGVLGNIIGGFINLVKSIVGIVTTVVNDVKSTIKGLTTAFQVVFGGIGSIIGGVASTIGNAVKGIINTIIGVLNFFIGVIDKVIGGMNAVLGAIPTFGHGKIQIPTIPNIPSLAAGGIAMPTPGGTLVRVAEAGQAEAIIPLPSNMQGVQKGGDTIVNVNVQTNADPNAIARATVWGLRLRPRPV